MGTPRDTREVSRHQSALGRPVLGLSFPLGRSPTDADTHLLTQDCPQWDAIDSGSPERLRQLCKEKNMNGKGAMTRERSEQWCLFMGNDQGPGKSALL